MPLTIIKIYLFIAFLGHTLCCFCGRVITYTPNGQFTFKDLSDTTKLAKLFEGSTGKRQLFSMLGVISFMLICTAEFIKMGELKTIFNDD